MGLCICLGVCKALLYPEMHGGCSFKGSNLTFLGVAPGDLELEVIKAGNWMSPKILKFICSYFSVLGFEGRRGRLGKFGGTKPL